MARRALEQEKLFKEFGITYFEDTEEEIKELKIKREEEQRAFDEKIKEIDKKIKEIDKKIKEIDKKIK